MIDTTSEKRTYAAVDGSLGKSGETMSCTQADADPDNGTSDYAESVTVMVKRSLQSVGWLSRFLLI
jgi:hypothetical protein